MTNRAELLEAALEVLPEGAALLGEDAQVFLWNRAAEAMTGYTAADLLGRPFPRLLHTLLLEDPAWGGDPDLRAISECSDDESGNSASPGSAYASAETYRHGAGHGTFVHAQHKMGHQLAAMTRNLLLRDEAGRVIGKAVLFHPAECLDALPQGETNEDREIEASQEDLKERLESLFEDFTQGSPAYGVLWISVDQAHDLRKTHGVGACEAMLKKVERALSQGLRPAERMGRWGEDEFLVISHERTTAMLAVHAQVLARLARTADFRWWGDRVSLTVSVGAAQAELGGTLMDLLERARAAMISSSRTGGNQITQAPEGHTCSRS